MFGLLLGVSIFSVSVQKRAQIEMEQMRENQLSRQEAEVSSLRKAVELAVMTENSASKTATYQATPDAARIRERASLSTGKTRATEDTVMVSGTTGTYGERSRILITTTDDEYARDNIQFTKGHTYSSIGQNTMQQRADTTVVDTTALRNEQIAISYKNMEAQAALVYNWWSAPGNGFVFPTSGQYSAEIMPISAYKDFWGSDFTYSRTSAQIATLSFTPPWGGSPYEITLNMTSAASSSSSSSGACVDPGSCGKSERWVTDPYCLCTPCSLMGSPDGGYACAPGTEFNWSSCACDAIAMPSGSGTSTSSGPKM